MRLLLFLLCGTILLLVACRKETIFIPEPAEPVTTELMRGIPSRADSLHGFLLSAYLIERKQNQDVFHLRCIAVFNDPAAAVTEAVHRRMGVLPATRGAVAGNTVPGDVVFNGIELKKGFSNPVRLQTEMTGREWLNQRAWWSVSGAGSFRGFEVQLKDEYPLVLDTLAEQNLKISEGFRVDLQKLFSGWDSVVVQINDWNAQERGYLYKAVDASEAEVVFSAQELDFLSERDNLILGVRASRFFHRTVSGRRFLFELNTIVQCPLKITR